MANYETYKDIVIPEDIYWAICDELECEYIEFMGIS